MEEQIVCMYAFTHNLGKIKKGKCPLSVIHCGLSDKQAQGCPWWAVLSVGRWWRLFLISLQLLFHLGHFCWARASCSLSQCGDNWAASRMPRPPSSGTVFWGLCDRLCSCLVLSGLNEICIDAEGNWRAGLKTQVPLILFWFQHHHGAQNCCEGCFFSRLNLIVTQNLQSGKNFT